MKKQLFVFAALLLAVAFSAFTIKQGSQTAVWFDFSGTSAAQYSTLSLYTLDANNTPDCGTTDEIRCEILAEPIVGGPNDGKPDLSTIEDETFKP